MAINLGSIWWSVQVANANAAAEKADRVQQEFGQTAEQANRANRAVNKSSRSMGKYETETGRARGTTSRFKGTLGLLSTAIFFVTSGIASLLGISGSLVGAWGILTTAAATVWGWLVAIGGYLPSLSAIWATITGVVSGFVSWLLAGSAAAIGVAAAIGGLIGLAGVFVLEWTGVLDIVRNFGQYVGNVLPGRARDALLALISIFVGPLAVIGAAIAGFVKGTLRGGLMEGIDQAVANAKRVLDIFGGAWGRIFDGISEKVNTVIGGVKSTIRDGVNAITGIMDGLGSTISEGVRSAWNGAVPSHIQFPEFSIGGQHVGVNIPHIGTVGADVPEISLGGMGFDLPQLQTGGMVTSGGAAVLHSGEAVVPADVTRNINFDGMAQGEAVVPADVARNVNPDRTAQGGGGGGVTIREISIEIGDQSLDIRSMRPSEVRRLAEALAPELGREVESIISP